MAFRINYGRGVLSPKLTQKTAIKWFKGLGKYSKFATIEKRKEDGNWKPLKLVMRKS